MKELEIAFDLKGFQEYFIKYKKKEYKGELAEGKSKPYYIFDLDTHKTIDILESHTYDFLENYFSRFTLQERLNVEIVSMDLYSPFKRVVKDKLQHATIIADTFHFTRIATEPLD